MSVSVTSRYWMVVFYFLMAFVLMFAEQFAEDHHAPASTEAVSATHSSEAGPSPERNPIPLGVHDVPTTIDTGLVPTGAP